MFAQLNGYRIIIRICPNFLFFYLIFLIHSLNYCSVHFWISEGRYINLYNLFHWMKYKFWRIFVNSFISLISGVCILLFFIYMHACVFIHEFSPILIHHEFTSSKTRKTNKSLPLPTKSADNHLSVDGLALN